MDFKFAGCRFLVGQSEEWSVNRRYVFNMSNLSYSFPVKLYS